MISWRVMRITSRTFTSRQRWWEGKSFMRRQRGDRLIRVKIAVLRFFPNGRALGLGSISALHEAGEILRGVPLGMTVLVCVAFFLLAAGARAAAPTTVDYSRDIQPILSDNCY